MLNADWWIKRAFRNSAAIFFILLCISLVAHTPFGPFIILGAFGYIAYRIWTVRPERTAKSRQRNSAGAERTPVLPGEAHHR